MLGDGQAGELSALIGIDDLGFAVMNAATSSAVERKLAELWRRAFCRWQTIRGPSPTRIKDFYRDWSLVCSRGLRRYSWVRVVHRPAGPC